MTIRNQIPSCTPSLAEGKGLAAGIEACHYIPSNKVVKFGHNSSIRRFFQFLEYYVRAAALLHKKNWVVFAR